MMKAKYILWMWCMLFFVSCFEDEGNYSYAEVEDIEIGIEPSKIVYVGQPLDIPITLKTAYTDMEYEWYMYDPKMEEKYGRDETYEATLIGTEKDLLIPDMDWNTGIYTVMVKAISKSNGYAVSAKTSVEVMTELSRGFYALKEDGNGNTEVDLYNKENEPVLANLLQSRLGEALSGKPLNLGVLYGHGYINPETDEMITCNTVAVTTEAGKISFFRTDNLLKVHDEADIRYGGMDEGEKPLSAFTFGLSNFLITNKKVAGTYASSSSMGSTGIFGTTSGTGASRFFMQDGSMLVYYWNEDEQRIDYLDMYSFGHGFYGEFKDNGFSTKGMECIACGSSQASKTLGVVNFFLLKDASGKKWLYRLGTDDLGIPQIAETLELASDSKFANATHYATNELSATFVYYVYDNKLYVFNLDGNVEDDKEIPLAGIPSDEPITYLSYQYMNSTIDSEYNFTHLVVGTQKGNTYKVYMYDISAGFPQSLARSFSGEGRLVSVNYISSKHEAGAGSVSLPN